MSTALEMVAGARSVRSVSVPVRGRLGARTAAEQHDVGLVRVADADVTVRVKHAIVVQDWYDLSQGLRADDDDALWFASMRSRMAFCSTTSS
jgi:hypothetical protein